MEDMQDSPLSFEDFKNENGMCYWWATDLLLMLGYKDLKSFQKVLGRATNAFISLNIPHYDNIIPTNRTVKDENVTDFKLTRFACYLIAMNADPKKVEVAKVQSYFIQHTREFELAQEQEQVERLTYRTELTEGNKSLASTAKKARIEDFAKFQNAGYLGMYNMTAWNLEKKRNIKKGTLADHMSRAELAANLFRVTQTEERIKSRSIVGQSDLEKTHREVGSEVREMITRNTGKPPEEMKVEKELKEVRKELKKGHQKMKKIDTGKKKK